MHSSVLLTDCSVIEILTIDYFQLFSVFLVHPVLCYDTHQVKNTKREKNIPVRGQQRLFLNAAKHTIAQGTPVLLYSCNIVAYTLLLIVLMIRICIMDH